MAPPAAAAEFLDLAIRLGGDTLEHRIRSAACHFGAGDAELAATQLSATIKDVAPGPLRAEALNQLALVRVFDQSFPEAADLLRLALSQTDDDLTLQVRTLVALSWALVNAGHFGEAVDTVEDAVGHASRLGHPDLLCQALCLRVVMRFMRGEAIDGPSLQRALELEGSHTNIPLPFRPSMQNVMMLAWTGQLDQARDELLSIRRRCLEEGDESGFIYVAFHTVLTAIWRADLIEAMLLAEDTVERATQLGGDVSLCVALTIRAAASAYGGRADDARRDIAGALTASRRCGSYRLAEWPITILGFLEVFAQLHEGRHVNESARMCEPVAALTNSQTPLYAGVPAARQFAHPLPGRDPSLMLISTRDDDASSRPGRAPESTCSSTYREAAAAHQDPEAEELEGAEGWVPHRCLDLDWLGRGPRDSRCGRHSCPTSPGRKRDSGSSGTTNPLGTSDSVRSTDR
ncbi:MAG: hypothetical protein QOG75_4643, partial [Mycobacterium sp.]|nr:hypothetical protein [Mycobacterium sp.]